MFWTYRTRIQGADCRLLECEPNQHDSNAELARDAARQAVNFVSAYDRCFEERRTTGPSTKFLIMPGIACGAFALELVLKAMLYVNNIAPKDHKGRSTHDLSVLFGLLPADIKARISSVFPVPDEAFQLMLRSISRLFETSRYSYELTEKLIVDVGFLHELILTLEPEMWNLAGGPAPHSFGNSPDRRVIAIKKTSSGFVVERGKE